MIETCILLLFMVASPTKLNETWNQTNTRTALERLYQDHDTGASPWDDHFSSQLRSFGVNVVSCL
jgi:hypothetical protein